MGLAKLLCHTCCQYEQAVRHRMLESITHFSPSSCKKSFMRSLFTSHPSMDLCCLWGSEYLICLSFIYSFHLTVPLKSSLFLSVDHSAQIYFVYIILEATIVPHQKILLLLGSVCYFFTLVERKLLWEIYFSKPYYFAL